MQTKFDIMVESMIIADNTAKKWDALSQFYHDVSNQNLKSLLDSMRKYNPRIEQIPIHELQCHIAALVEYTFNQCSETPPQWTSDRSFVFSDIKESQQFKLLTSENKSKIHLQKVEEALLKDRCIEAIKHNLPRTSFYTSI